ncbi:MAG: TonB-dependent receptor [Nitrospiraceae bacterium]|nr:TonB-dependent receptor [Nitrospiraceae bacterium]
MTMDISLNILTFTMQKKNPLIALAESLRSVLSIVGILLAFSSISHAQNNEDKDFLLMYFKEEELVVESPTRAPKSTTQVAENVTVVTADDIKLMNAHTLADVLNTVTGVQVLLTGGPGSSAVAYIQGSDKRHVAVFMDGIPLNNLSDNLTEIGAIPVQNIEKIEIIKGPASSAWGSALGGVVNIITKSGSENSSPGMVSASYGERSTSDLRLETSGKQDRLGYYITAGELQMDGFRSHNGVSGNNAYTKLTYDLTKDTSAMITMGFNKAKRGDSEYPASVYLPDGLFIDNTLETWSSSLSLNSKLNEETVLALSFWHLRQDFENYDYQLLSGAELENDRYIDDGYGTSATLTWKHQQQNVVLGADYNSKTLTSNKIADGKKGREETAFFINDTVSIGHLSMTPGVRYDRSNTNGDFASPSFGVTYKLTNTTLLRAYTAKAFNVPPLAETYGDNVFHVSNPNLKMEEVLSYEAGLETTAVDHLWLKMSFFRHDMKDVITTVTVTGNTFTSINEGKERRQGLEAELKTEPVFNTSLSAGATFMSAKDPDTGQTIQNVPQRTYDVGLRYDDNSFKALLNGHYIYWNVNPALNGKYNSMVFDLHITQDLHVRGLAVEAFADIHNIFDNSQYFTDVYKTPVRRWVEAGVRYMF